MHAGFELSVALALACALELALAVEPGPRYPSTSGEVWPKPQLQDTTATYFTFDPSKFSVKVTGHNCSILWKAIHQYSYKFRELSGTARRARRSRRRRRPTTDVHAAGHLTQLLVNLQNPCEDIPHVDMDESYNLSVSMKEGEGEGSLTADSVWGALRGLETFSQMFYIEEDVVELRINASSVRDWPRYAHRGVLIDTGRHFIPLPDILRLIDAMQLNKMNVLHWHLVDDQSFPYESDVMPELSNRGAYHPRLTYSGADVAHVVRYAADRAVRVLPEIDVPGHTRSWGVAYPSLLTRCGEHGGRDGAEYGALHPVREGVYRVVERLLTEAVGRFPDKYLHLGGDEVDMKCWESNAELQEYMRKHNMSSGSDLHALFMRRVLDLMPNNTKPVLWQEVFDEGVPLPNGTLIQAWKTYADSDGMAKMLEAGHLVVYSTDYYLDHLENTFQLILLVEPRTEVATRVGELIAQRIVGGEAAMWGEMVDDTNMHSRMWPRASAVAERLWGAPLNLTDTETYKHTMSRANELACRMRRRGIPAEPPAGPSYCLL